MMRSLYAAALGLCLAGCPGWRYQAGLANAPAMNRPFDPEDFRHDAIANGDESCPASGRPEDDPLFRRWPACGGSIFPARKPRPAQRAAERSPEPARPAAQRAPRPGPLAD